MCTIMVSIFIVDDHPVVVEGLKSVIEKLEGLHICGIAYNAVAAINTLKTVRPDVLLLDINLPDISGVDLCKKIRKEFPDIKIVGISTFSERSYISRMIENGAMGYLVKSASAEEIADAIATVMQGKLYMSLNIEYLLRPSSVVNSEMLPNLTKREKEVLQYIAEGLTNNQIADKIFVSTSTVDTHRKNMITKLGVSNTASLIRFAVEHGLID
ncbi:DNA-binding response regulator [Parapedobacter defluvii]|uniref:DNA-binding response regulator n=2 Tax=Parapedobacter defluvii TaxID=2045106 RepID=A0ABQ1MYP5_9SPHI|nr:DNA-binding response regulator [Parapedobacter defluvii]